MGGKTDTQQTQNQTSQATPWGPAASQLQGLLSQIGGINPNLTGNENAALTGLSSTGNAAGQFLPQAQGVLSNLFGGGPDRSGMVNDAYQQYQQALAPTAGGQYLDPSSNPFYQQMTDTIARDTRDAVNAEYAGAGRDPAGAGSYEGVLGRKIAEGIAPVAAGVYNSERGRQMDAITGQYGAGGQTAGLLSGLDQTRFGNQVQGLNSVSGLQSIAASPYASMLQAEAARRGIPLETMAQQMGLVLPAADAFGTKTGTGTTSGTSSGPWWEPFAVAAGTAAKAYGGK